MKTKLIQALLQYREECRAQGRSDVADWADGALRNLSTAEGSNARMLDALLQYEDESAKAGYISGQARASELVRQLDSVLIREAQASKDDPSTEPNVWMKLREKIIRRVPAASCCKLTG